MGGLASLSKENIYTIFILQFDALGQKYRTSMLPTLRFISDVTSNNPENSGAIVCAPNTGEGVAYNEK